jgi:hypothetical protein
MVVVVPNGMISYSQVYDLFIKCKAILGIAISVIERS